MSRNCEECGGNVEPGWLICEACRSPEHRVAVLKKELDEAREFLFECRRHRAELAALRAESVRLASERDEARAEVERLRGLINTPRTDDFFEAVRIEAAHQIERWGVEHDAGKRAEDWIALLSYLLGKATKAHYDNDEIKLKHHVVTVAAVCLNWLRNLNGESTLMRPGVAPRDAEKAEL